MGQRGRPYNPLFEPQVLATLGYVKVAIKPDCLAEPKEHILFCKEIGNWVENNTKSHWFVEVDNNHDVWFLFSDDEDNVAFKLVWG